MRTSGYLLISAICLSIFYLVYLLAFKKETNFKLIRFYLLTSIVLSLILPVNFFQIKIDFSKYRTGVEPSAVTETIYDQKSRSSIKIDDLFLNEEMVNQVASWMDFIAKIYVCISIILLLRIVWNIGLIILSYRKSEKTIHAGFTIVHSRKRKDTYSFFNWIFIDPNNQSNEDIDQIISHEKIHTSQYHSFDIILIEILSAIMWFNPFVWMIRKELKLVHEYLADEGVVNAGIDKLSYEALLINQVTEEKLIVFASNFNSSTIKKRIIMLNTSKSEHQKRFKKWIIIPVGITLFMGIAIVNGQNNSNDFDSLKDQFVVVIDAGHGGSDTGAKTSENELEKDLNLSISKKLRERGNINPTIKIISTREDDNFITLNDRLKKAEDVKADLFISIHVDSRDENHQLSGINCYTSGISHLSAKSDEFGKVLIDELKQIGGIKTADEPRQADFFVLKNSNCPAVLLTIGYLTNENDLSFINDKKNQDLICEKIMNAVEKASIN
jgi:N-acetylmuramoyl-L-alanine amidase